MTAEKCPLCKQDSQYVSKITVESLVKDYFKRHLKSSQYNFCSNPECSIAYFSVENEEIYFERDLVIPGGIKDSVNPVICYCKNISMSDLINDIVVKKTSSTLEEVIRNTGAGSGNQCKTSNPSGNCCMPALQVAVEHCIKMRNEKGSSPK